MADSAHANTDDLDKTLFEHAITTYTLLERRAYVGALIAFVVSTMSVLLNMNAISAGPASVVGISVHLTDVLTIRLTLTLAALAGGLIVAVLTLEALSAIMRINYYASTGNRYAHVFVRGGEHQLLNAPWNRVRNIVFGAMLIVSLSLLFLLPVVTFLLSLSDTAQVGAE